MRKITGFLALAIGLLLVVGILRARAPEVDDDLWASRRLFPSLGPGLRALRHSANGNYYVLISSGGVSVFDSSGRKIAMIAAPAPAPAPPPPTSRRQAVQSPVGFAVDCDVDDKGNVYLADGQKNIVTEFDSTGKTLHSFPANAVTSLAVLPTGEVAVSQTQSDHHVTVYTSEGKIARQFGDIESMSSRPDIDHYLNLGRVASDPQGHIYYGFTYMPEPLVRQYDSFGDAKLDFEFTGVDAFPEASARRRAIERKENSDEPIVFQPILTGFGVDPVNGDLWMGLHNLLLHFDKDGIRRSEYDLYTAQGSPLDATFILVEENRLLIGSDPAGIYEFHRPDRKR
jgi:sugar lactone lactonase YvrE